MQSSIFVLTIFSAILAIFHVRAATFSNAGFLGWNELLQSKGIFEDGVNFIKSKSYDDSILLSEFTDLLKQDNILEKAYSNYKRLFDTNDRDRLDFFKIQLIDIASHNIEARSGKHTWTKGVNQFTHMTNDEFDSISSVNMAAFADSLGISNASQTFESKIWTSFKKAPSSMNWIDEGIVTPVKDQNRCNSCVMFASTAQLESVTALSRKTQPVSYSPQELVDCVVPSFTCKSEGSDPADIFRYLKSEGVSTWDSYPYPLPPSKGECRRAAGGGGDGGGSRAGKIQEYTGYQDISEDQLKEILVSDGPIFVAIKTYGGYGGGIYDGAECGNTPANHAVLLVGYGEENGVEFWRIKNSYGSNWGEDGYLRLRRNNGNVCQIAKSIVVSITAA